MGASDKFRRLFRLDRGVRDVDAAVNDEFGFHFEMTMRELLAAGMSREAAEQEARRRFGDVDAAKSRVRALAMNHAEHNRRVEWWSAVAQDFRYALRGMRSSPAFTLGVVITLGLGIGANATMFGIVDRLLLRKPAYLEAADRVGRVYLIRNNRDGSERIDRNLQYQRYVDLRENTRVFDAMAPYYESNVIIGDGQDAREGNVVMAGSEFWPMFKVRPVIGRLFTPDEDALPAGSAVAVLGYGYWQSRFGGRSDVLGEELRVGGKRYRIVGVAPRGFGGLSLRGVSVFVPFTAAGDDIGGPGWSTGYDMSWLEVVARRKPGASETRAEQELGLAYRRSFLKQLESRGVSDSLIDVFKPRALFGSVLSDRGPQARSDARVALWLFGVTGIVLLIAAANVAGLLVARAIRRRREIAVRIALGVSRGRLFTMLAVEALTLSALGAMLGLVLAEYGGRVLRAALMRGVDADSVLRDPRTLCIALGVAVLCGSMAGVAPIVHAGRTDLAEAMRGGHRDGAASRSRLRTGLLVFQAALSVVLLVGAGLFVRSLRNAKLVSLGYQPELVTYISVDRRGYDFAPGDTGSVRRTRIQGAALAQRNRLLATARALPGVESASITWGVPFWQTIQLDLFVPGVDSVGKLGDFIMNGVAGDYFRTTGTRILRGRPILDSDGAGSPRVIVVSDAMAQRLWLGADPLGKCVKVDADTVPCSTVVGVAEGIMRGGDWGEDAKLQYYIHIDQYSPGSGGIFVRTRRPASETSESVRRELQKLVPVPQYVNGRSLESIVAPNMRQWQLGATMFTLFGSLALVLAAVGLYSIISYSVAQRMHEMGIRIALGAKAGDVVGMVMSEGIRLTLFGLAIGAALSFYAAPYVQKMLFRVEAREPAVFLLVGAILLAVAALATLIPAWRAARVDPQEALRAE